MELFYSLPVLIPFILVLALLSFFFSAAETSIIGLSKIRLRHMVSRGIRRAGSIQRLVQKLDKVITAILIGNNFVAIALSAIVTAVCVQRFGYNWGILIATFSSTLFILIFCEITPKILATKQPERTALFTAPIMEVMIKVLKPVIAVLIAISNSILKIFRVGPVKRSPLITEEELRMLIEIGKDEGFLTDDEKRMLHRILEFGDTVLSTVMVPKERMVAVNLGSTSDQVLGIFVEEGHARLPVYKDTKDNIVGIVYAHDLLYILRDKTLFVLQDLIHPPCYVNGSMRVNDLLRKFQADKLQIAIVVDAHNKALGLVTLEDLVEEIVGEIEENAHASIKHKWKK